MNLHKLQMENIQTGRDDLKKIIEKGKRNRKQALHPETLITRRYPTKFADIYGGISQQEIKKVKAAAEQVIIFGDSANDHPLFERFPNSVAMGNADRITRQKAAHVTATNNEEGVRQYLQSIGL